MTTPELPPVEYAQRTDPGRDPDKQVNEDAAAHKVTRFGHLCVVCDGMGGHAGGKEASNLALAVIGEMFDAAPEGAAAREVLASAIEEANARVYAMGPVTKGAGRPGSTVVCVLLHADGVEIGHVGDSRVYMVHQGQISQVTKDHSMVQEMVDIGALTAEQAMVHPDANKITRALGMGPEVDVEVRSTPIAHVAGDTFILCSDGLSDLVRAPEILQIAGSAPAAQAAGQLVDLANARGGHDNITVVILRAKESALASPHDTLPQTTAQTVVEPGPSAPRALAPTITQGPAPALEANNTRRRPSRSLLMVGLVLAAIGVAALMVALYINLRLKRAPSVLIESIPTYVADAEATLAPMDAGQAVAEDADPPPALDPPAGSGRHGAKRRAQPR